MMKRQRGLTAISWIIVIALVSVQGLMALRIIPLYMNYNSAVSIMDGLVNEPEARGKSAKEIMMLIRKRLDINGLYELRDSKEAFKFAKGKLGLKVILHYEQRGPIFKNLEFVATFDHEVEIPR